MIKDTTFSFGKNWEEFIKRNFSEEIVETSKLHILNFLKVPDLKNKSFLDVGCGSGLSSLAAYRAGASKIISFDNDEYSVKTTLKLREMEGNPQNWKVTEGSILDTKFISEIDKKPAGQVWWPGGEGSQV
ncbi:50S ribosomal protein L11 methyltransferase [Patescibacteria group bacterium]|nr:50S ribosomal protein L11 methyltransferase [Patescibacteria group bacterium]